MFRMRRRARREMRRAGVLVALSALCWSASAPAETIPSFQGLGYALPDDTMSSARGIARDGSAIVGTSGGGGISQAFLWTPEQGMIGLGGLNPNQQRSWAYSVANDGVAVVGESRAQYSYHAFRWTPAEGMVDMDDRPGWYPTSSAWGVSTDGSVVVGARNSLGAFRWTAETGMVDLGALPGYIGSGASAVSADGSVVVGRTYDDDDEMQAYYWTAEGGMVGLGDLPGGQWPLDSEANAVSADGSVIVGAGESSAGREAVRWTTAGEMLSLGDLPGGYTDGIALGVSADGSVVVGMGTLGWELFDRDAFIWDEEHGIRLLKDALEDEYGLDLTGWRLLAAEGISDDGCTIVGTGFRSDGHAEAWIARIPEPGALFLMAIGLAAAGLARRRVS